MLSRSLTSSLHRSLCHPSSPGRPTGEGYAEFATPEEASGALREKQHGSLGSRYVELFAEVGADPERDPTSAGRPLPGGLGNPVLRLRGLPFTATAQDVVDFLIGAVAATREEEGVEEKPTAKEETSDDGGENGEDGSGEDGEDSSGKERRQQRARRAAPPPTNPEAMPRRAASGVVFTSSPDGRPSGEAYVEFESPQAASSALRVKDGAALGPRYVSSDYFFFSTSSSSFSHCPLSPKF